MKKPIRKNDRNDVQIIVRNWNSIPVRLRRMMVNAARWYDMDEGVRFPTPIGAKWKHVEIIVYPQEWALVRVKRVTRSYSYGRMGLADRRRPMTPRAEWKLLRSYAESKPGNAYAKLPRGPNLKMAVSRLRKWLKTFFGIPGDPLQSFYTTRWQPRFKIRVARK